VIDFQSSSGKLKYYRKVIVETWNTPIFFSPFRFTNIRSREMSTSITVTGRMTEDGCPFNAAVIEGVGYYWFRSHVTAVEND